MKIKNWDIFIFVAAYHIALVCLLPAFVEVFSWSAIALFLTTYILGGLSITVGYHRLYAHKSYCANPLFEWGILFSSALAFEMSALNWSHDHRIHHNCVDTHNDPHSIDKGFWYAHILWLFDYKRNFDRTLVADLIKNPRVMIQHNYYSFFLIGINLLTFLIGWVITGSALASFYMGFLARIAMIHHCTWFINSLCHTFGAKTFARELSAVDNAIMAMLTFGEGYHNYHHAYAADYRNGIRWYHFDPSKWVIWLASKIKLVKRPRIINEISIQKSLIYKDKKMILEHIENKIDNNAKELKEKLETLSLTFNNKASIIKVKIRELKKVNKYCQKDLLIEVKHLKLSLKETWNEWLKITKEANKQYNFIH
jgi:stearoyl-CoA desaturase (delta-9 desaturase)